MSLHNVVTDNGPVLGLGANPNTTPPTNANRIIQVPAWNGGGDSLSLYVAPVGGGITVRFWRFLPELSRWFAMGAATAYLVDEIVQTPPVVWGAPSATASNQVFAEVTANAACTKFGIGFMRGRP